MAAETCEPVYVTARALPLKDNGEFPETIDLCAAAEKTVGRGSIRGAQRIRGLWLIYPRRKDVRDRLLVEGMSLWGVQVALLHENPYIRRDRNGLDKPATKLWISNIPLGIANEDLEAVLIKLGCEFQSRLKTELARTKDGKLTQWETGRRFVFITVPSAPLPRTVKVGRTTADLFHREMKESQRQHCTNCLLPDHVAANCGSPVVCLACLQPGHKRADCRSPLTDNDPIPSSPPSQETDAASSQSVPAPPSPPPPPSSETDAKANSQPDLASPLPAVSPAPSQDPEVIPPTQQEQSAVGKGKKTKKQTKLHQVLAALNPSARTHSHTKRPLHHSSSSEEVDVEQSSKRPVHGTNLVPDTQAEDEMDESPT